MSLKQKYLKYKSKYLALKKQIGGECNPIPTENYKDPINLENLLDRPPEHRITVNGKCYDIRDIYKWIFKSPGGEKDTDPHRIPVDAPTKMIIRNTYNNIPLTAEEERSAIDYIRRLDPNRPMINVSERYKSNKNVVLALVNWRGLELLSAPKFQTDREVVLAAVKNDRRALKYVPTFNNDKEIVLAAVRQDGNLLENASIELRADRDVVLAAVKQSGRALHYASRKLKEDREIVLAAVKQYGHLLKYAAEKLRADKEVVLAAVRQDAFALEYASVELRADREIVLAAVKKHRDALKYASVELQNDPEIIAAVRNR
jgi:hypothetical protein